MELYRVNTLGVVSKSVNYLLRREVPQLDGPVLRARGNKPCVGSEGASLNPVHMCLNGKHEFSIRNSMNHQ